MKSFFTLFFATLCSIAALAYDFESNGIYYNFRVGYEVVVTQGWYTGDVVIPDTVIYGDTTYNVTSIGASAFYGCKGLTSITIPNSVTSIGDHAFYECSGLTSVTIPNSVTSIGNWAFVECSGLTSITIPNSVTSIGNGAFSGCSSLTSITIPNSVTSIGDYAFRYCTVLTSITIPNSVTSIGEEAFYECSSLTSVTIPNSVTSIGERAFYRCKSLTSITIPNSVTSIGSNAFYDCFFTKNNFINNSSLDEVANKYWGAEIADIEQDGLLICNDTVVGCRPMVTSVIIPDTITCIGNYAFQDCSALTSITIPNSVTYIGDWAFQYCTALTSITIPNSVTTMGGAVFYGCSSLASVVLPENMTSINTYVDCPQESAFCFSWGFFEGCSSLTSLTIPNSVTSIGELTFKGCSSLKSIIIPDNVTTLGAGLFHGCSSLESVVFSKNIQYIPSSHTNDYWEYFGFFGECNALKEITLKSETPPPFDRSAFDGLFSSIAVYVPCGSVDLYKNTDGWNEFTNIQEPLAEYAISLVYDEKKGHATVDKNNYCSNQISAIANYGYHFTQWSDGVTDNPRSLVLTQDTTLTAEFAPNQYAISTLSNDLVMGSTMGDTVVNYLEYVTIWAEANYGYHFTQWNDGVAENPRTLQVTNDGTYTAQFEKNVYTVTYFYNSEQGAVEGVTSAEYLDVVVLNALPHYGYHFTQWSDGVTENPRSLILTQDTTFTAEFEQSYSGQCGENLYWEFNSNVLTITGSGTMYDERPWGLFVEQIQKVSLPVGITHIGNDAFQDCLGLRQIDIPYTVESIGDYSFNGCRRLYYINCYPLLPPYAESTSFSNYSVNLYAPCDNLDDYRYDMVFGQFKYFECIGSESTTTDGVVVKPGSTDVTITWPTDDDAATYSIEIKKNDEIFCILIFNAEGQLLNISFAPSRDGNNRASYAAQAANGLRFTVTGLEEKTTYGYDVTSKDEESNTLDTYSGEFTTAADTNGDVTMGTDELVIESSTNKLLINGQLCLLRDGKIYNVMGVEIQ